MRRRRSLLPSRAGGTAGEQPAVEHQLRAGGVARLVRREVHDDRRHLLGRAEALQRRVLHQRALTLRPSLVVAGTYDAAAIERAIRAGHGTASLKTVAGGTLTARMNGPRNIVVKDAQGNVANVATYDVRQSNGIIHVIDRVLLPAM